MVTQKGDVWLRGKTLLIAVFIGMLSSVSVSFAVVALAQAEEISPGQSAQREFNTSAAVYRGYVKDDVMYRTDIAVTSLRFVARAGDSSEEIIGATPEVNGDTMVWRPAGNPVTGSQLIAQTQADDAAAWTDLDGSVALRAAPVLSVAPFSTPRGGATLEVVGSVAGVPSDIITEVRAELYPAGGEVAIRSEVVLARDAADIGLATLSLDGLDSGQYRVELIARDAAGREVARAPSQTVDIRRTIPSVVTMAATPRVVYASTAVTVYGQLNAPDGVAQAELRYGDQSRILQVAADGSFSVTFSDGLSAGKYDFYVFILDRYGNTNDGVAGAQGQLTLEVLRPMSVTTPVPFLLQPLEKDTTRRLSTNFSTLIATNRSIASAQNIRTAIRAEDASAVLGAETAALEGVIDLEDNSKAVDLPVEATPRGWMIFGTPWYWWLTGSMAAAGASVYAFRWAVRRV